MMMKRSLAAAALAFALPLSAQNAEEPSYPPSPSEIINAAPQSDWVAIPPEDLLVMKLAPDKEGNKRTVIIQLMPAPFSQGWVSNIRTLARAHWYDGISVNRVQDNYVVQWGDPNYDNPEASGEAKPLPEGLNVMTEDEYAVVELSEGLRETINKVFDKMDARKPGEPSPTNNFESGLVTLADFHYGFVGIFEEGFPVAWHLEQHFQSIVNPVHCYGMVGVGRSYSPDTGSGAELYTVIGHAPRHLDRNIALAGRIIEGMEHLSSLPRGKGALGFYAEDEIEKRTPILSIRVASDLPAAEQPTFEYLSTESESFAQYARARANRKDAFFLHPAGGADICNIPVPIRTAEAAKE